MVSSPSSAQYGATVTVVFGVSSGSVENPVFIAGASHGSTSAERALAVNTIFATPKYGAPNAGEMFQFSVSFTMPNEDLVLDLRAAYSTADDAPDATIDDLLDGSSSTIVIPLASSSGIDISTTMSLMINFAIVAMMMKMMTGMVGSIE